MVLGDLLSTHLNFIRNVLYILLGIRYFQLGIVINGMIGFYFFKLAQSIWLGCWNKEGIQNLSVVCKIRSCLIVSPSRQDRSISSAGDLPLLSHNWRKKDLFSSVYHHKPFINQAWQVRWRKGGGGSNSQSVLSLETKRTTLRNTACLIYTLTLNGYKEAAWPSGQRVGLVIPLSQVRVRLWTLAGIVRGLPEFKSL